MYIQIGLLFLFFYGGGGGLYDAKHIIHGASKFTVNYNQIFYVKLRLSCPKSTK